MGKLSKEITKISLYKEARTFLRLDFLPFAILYVSTTAYGISNELPFEYTAFGIGVVFVLQAITILSQQWSVGFKCFAAYSKVSKISEATFVKVDPASNKGKTELCPLTHDNESTDYPYWFLFQKRKISFNSEANEFQKLDYPVHLRLEEYRDSKGHSNESYKEALRKFGPNKFDIPRPNFMDLYKEQMLAPFFVFQLFCVGLWCLDEYWQYSIFTLVLLLLFEATVTKSRLKNLEVLRNMGLPSRKINVLRENKWIEINSYELVPGDICSLGRSGTTEIICPCDMLLLRGNCVVNEAMLTGESTPHLKESLTSHGNHKDILNSKKDSLHLLYSGTTILQHGPERGSSERDGCITFILKTGFGTTQGKLMRMILFSTERITANTKEAFGFIGFLLIFAIAASGYVLREGLEDESRSRYKLLLHCVMIITSVVPPELPMELSLAVNNSLIALHKLGIFCTEPFRIPFAGKIDVCCFDKTGTLTSDNLILKGIAGINSMDSLLPPTEIPDEVGITLGGCNSLLHIDGKLMGDPMETASLKAIGWSSKGDVAVSQKGKYSVRIIHRYHFSSELKRMSTIVSLEGERTFYALIKGAPEKLKSFYDPSSIPSHYDETFKYFSRQGRRVIALGYKTIPENTTDELKRISREDLENNFKFGGFAVFDCPLKPDSATAILQLTKSSHKVAMITGDNTLTACQVSTDLKMVDKPVLILTETLKEVRWISVDETQSFPLTSSNFKDLCKRFDFCISGSTLSHFISDPQLRKQLGEVRVFARVNPDQKELIVTTLKNAGYHVLMCGDGTNDVGALKQAHVGVALLNQSSINPPKKSATVPVKGVLAPAQSTTTNPSNNTNRRTNVPNTKRTMEELMKELEEADGPLVQLGDASIASPFTSKGSSVIPVTHILRQGRCTLVTTMQMFKILALNCLISAYSLSVMYLAGIKLGDTQATLTGMLIAVCFLFISRSKPLPTLSKQKPLSNLFSPFMFLSIMGQFAIHLTCLMAVQAKAMEYSGEEKISPDSDFKPNLINSGVFLISAAMQVTTFAVNYQGHPFMESMRENKGLFYCLMGMGGLTLFLAAELDPSVNETFELVSFPPEFRNLMVPLIIVDFAASYLVEQILVKIFRV